MKFYPLSLFSVAALMLSAPVCWAGVCSGQIGQVETQINDRFDALAEAGPTANQTVAAMMHRQPTPRTVAAAEVGIGDLSPETLHVLADAMGRARRDDISGERADCERALAIARRAIGR